MRLTKIHKAGNQIYDSRIASPKNLKNAIKPWKICLLMLTTMLVTGCWQKSLNPFYTAQDLIFEPTLVGSWKEQEDSNEKTNMWTFTKADRLRYKLEILDEDHVTHRYDAYLFKFGHRRLLDIFEQDRSISSIPAHHLLAVDEIGESLHLRMLNMDWISEWLKTHPDALRHIKISDPEKPEDRTKDEIVLTAETQELQNFVSEHLDEENFFTDACTLKKASSTSTSNIKSNSLHE